MGKRKMRPCSAFMACVLIALMPGLSYAQERSIHSPILHVNVDKGWLTVDANGIVTVEASEAARPHLAKLPEAGMIEIVVEMRGTRSPPLLKRWKLTSGESTCRVFDGTSCK
jgi:hypothetical protein